MGLSVKITKNKLPQLEGAIRQRARQIVAKTAMDIEGQAKDRVAIDTGATFNTIQAKPLGDLSWVIVASTEYAAYLEYGTYRTPAKPYMTPAAEFVRPSFNGAFRDLLKGVA